MLIMLFSLIFIGVGSTSLAYAQSFGSVLKDYCIQKCAESALLKDDDPVGCDCKPEPGRTTLPTQVFLVRASPIVRARTIAHTPDCAIPPASTRGKARKGVAADYAVRASVVLAHACFCVCACACACVSVPRVHCVCICEGRRRQ